MTLNPLLPLDYGLIIAVALLALAGYAAWSSAYRARPRTRVLVAVLRLLAVAAFLLLLANPGTWQRPRGSLAPRWTILLDRSQSMDTPDEDGTSRWEAAVDLAKQAVKQSGGPTAVDLAVFGEQLADADADRLAKLAPDEQASDLIGALGDLLARHAAAPEALAGILVLSDGAQLPTGDPATVVRQARALGVPIWAVPLGGEVVPPNLRVTPRRRHLTGFAGQEVPCVVTIDSRNLPPAAVLLRLADGDGNVLGEQRVEVPANSQREARFAIRLPDQPGLRRWHVSAPVQDGEQLAIDNQADIGVSVLAGKVRVLVLEGTPGWDSKFLARVLRKQPNLEVSELYRLGPTRQQWLTPSGETTDFGPGEGPLAKGFDGFDLVVCGRGIDEILDEPRASQLHRFVAERGGCVLFARGNPARRAVPDLQALFPLAWREFQEGSFRWQPVVAGQRLGLFGERLPGREAPVWEQLPALSGAFSCADRLPPGSTVLAQALARDGTAHPLLASRRVGLGLAVAFNGGDFWQWDFFPQTPRSKELYQAFWPQLVQWMLGYAEFLPGQPLALRLSRDAIQPGETVGIHVLSRSGIDPTQIRLRSCPPDADRPVAISLQGAADALPRAAVILKQPGQHCVEAYLEGDEQTTVRTPVQVLSPPPETARRSADPDFLRRLAEDSAGRLLAWDELGALPLPETADATSAELVWIPAWDRLWILLALALTLGLEWIVRRRSAVP